MLHLILAADRSNDIARGHAVEAFRNAVTLVVTCTQGSDVWSSDPTPFLRQVIDMMRNDHFATSISCLQELLANAYINSNGRTMKLREWATPLSPVLLADMGAVVWAGFRRDEALARALTRSTDSINIIAENTGRGVALISYLCMPIVDAYHPAGSRDAPRLRAVRIISSITCTFSKIEHLRSGESDAVRRCVEICLGAIERLSRPGDPISNIAVLLPHMRAFSLDRIYAGMHSVRRTLGTICAPLDYATCLDFIYSYITSDLCDLCDDLCKTNLGRDIFEKLGDEPRCDYAGCTNLDGPNDKARKTFKCGNVTCSSRYCTRECQAKAWKMHRACCQSALRRRAHASEI